MAATQIRADKQIMAGTLTNAEISASAAIALSKLSEAVIQADGGQAFTADQPMGGFKLTGLGTPSAATDAATKSYVDSIAVGLKDFKESVRVATTSSIADLSDASVVIDGVTCVEGDRVLVKDDASIDGTEGIDAKRNGIYVIGTVTTGTAPFTRSTDADASAEVNAGLYAFVSEGSTNLDTSYVLATNDPITLDTTGLTFVKFSGAGQIIAGTGLTKSGNTINAIGGNGITANANDLAVTPDSTGGANLSTCINVSANGVAVAVDDSSIEDNGSNRLRIKAAGVGTTELSTAVAGTGMTGGGGAALNVVSGNGGIVANANDITLTANSTGGANLSTCINVSANGVAVSVDDSTIEDNGSDQLRVKAAGITGTQINTSVAGNGLTGGGGSALSIDLDGSTLAVSASGLKLGDLANGKVYIGNGSNVATAYTLTTRETPTGLINSSNTSYSLAATPFTGTEHIYLNGLLQEEGVGNDYTISGGTITMLTAPETASKLLVTYMGT